MGFIKRNRYHWQRPRYILPHCRNFETAQNDLKQRLVYIAEWKKNVTEMVLLKLVEIDRVMKIRIQIQYLIYLQE